MEHRERLTNGNITLKKEYFVDGKDIKYVIRGVVTLKNNELLYINDVAYTPEEVALFQLKQYEDINLTYQDLAREELEFIIGLLKEKDKLVIENRKLKNKIKRLTSQFRRKSMEDK